MQRDEKPFEHLQDTQNTHIHKDHEIEVPVTEEELVAETHEVERGSIRVEKTVVEEERTLEIPLIEEEATVTRRKVDREIDPDTHDFGGDLTVTVMGEEVDVQKQARVVEEVEIHRTPVTHDEEVSGTVRREEVRIEREDDTIDER